jgi:rhomboid family GlyGly-CTERM serine protease
LHPPLTRYIPPGIQITRSLRRHTPPLLLALFSLAATIAWDDLTLLLRYKRATIASGRCWRLFSGNMFHPDWSHLLMNLACLALIWALFYRHDTTLSWLAVTLDSGIGVTTGLWSFYLELNWHPGLSGLLHGLFVAGAVAVIRRGGQWGYLMMLPGIAIKLAYESLAGPIPGSTTIAEGAVVEESHRYRAIAGALTGLMIKPRRTSNRQTQAAPSLWRRREWQNLSARST